jgi:uncharacterized membrane protein
MSTDRDVELGEQLELLISKMPSSHATAASKSVLRLGALSFILTVIGDLVNSFDHYAINHDWFWVQMGTGIVNQTTWLILSFLFIWSDSKKERIAIGISQALGASVGSSIMLGYVKPYFVWLLT